jgi:DNA-binding transcriptional LysR family regulator
MKFQSTDELLVLVECGHGGNLTSAAELLDITPAAASAILRKLEARLGVKLVERTTRRLALTAEGQAMLGYAERALELLREGESLTVGNAKAPVGTVRVAAGSVLARQFLLPLVDSFLAEYPKAEVDLTVSDTVQDVVRDEVDVAFRYGDLKDARLASRKLANASRMVVAAPGYWAKHGKPAHPSELGRHDCITFNQRNRRHVLWQFTAAAGEAVSVRVTGRRSADDADIALRWALAGQGVLCANAFDLKPSLDKGLLSPALDGWTGEAEPLFAVLPANRFVPLRVKAFVDWVAAKAG